MKKNIHTNHSEDPLPEALKNAGKEIPYAAPEGYFDTLHDRIMERIDQEAAATGGNHRMVRFVPYRLRAVAAAAVILLLAGFTYALVSKVIIPVIKEYRTQNVPGVSDNETKTTSNSLDNTVNKGITNDAPTISPSGTAESPAIASDQFQQNKTQKTSPNTLSKSGSAAPSNIPPVSAGNTRQLTSSTSAGKWPFADTLVCRGTTLQYSTPFNPAEFSHQWMLDNRQLNSENGASFTLSTAALSAGTHRLSLVVRDKDFNGIAAVVNAGITVVEAPVLTGERKICAYDKAILKTGSKNPNWVYQWSSGERTPEITVATSGKYWVKVQVAGGNCFAADTFEVTVMPKPTVSLGSDRNICSGDKLNLSLKNPDDQWKITWTPGNLKSEQFVFNQEKPGIYKVRVDVTGCITHSDEVVIQVSDCSIFIPNIFTPNGDGKNDKFVIAGIESYGQSRLMVSDRNGILVFEDNNYQNDWDGGDLPNGTYFYLFYPGGNSSNFRKGTVMIMR